MKKIAIIYLTMSENIEEVSNILNRIKEELKDNQKNLELIKNPKDLDYVVFPYYINKETWNHDLSPWLYENKDQKMFFEGNAKKILDCIEKELVPNICNRFKLPKEEIHFIMSGYSLAGLFSLWSIYQTDIFSSVVSCSGSFWFPKFKEYIFENELSKSINIYLSLGKKEEKTNHPIMKNVGINTREIFQFFSNCEKVRNIELEWNEGGHFQNPTERMIKGIVWSIKNADE